MNNPTPNTTTSAASNANALIEVLEDHIARELSDLVRDLVNNKSHVDVLKSVTTIDLKRVRNVSVEIGASCDIIEEAQRLIEILTVQRDKTQSKVGTVDK